MFDQAGSSNITRRRGRNESPRRILANARPPGPGPSATHILRVGPGSLLHISRPPARACAYIYLILICPLSIEMLALSPRYIPSNHVLFFFLSRPVIFVSEDEDQLIWCTWHSIPPLSFPHNSNLPRLPGLGPNARHAVPACGSNQPCPLHLGRPVQCRAQADPDTGYSSPPRCQWLQHDRDESHDRLSSPRHLDAPLAVGTVSFLLYLNASFLHRG